CTNQERNHGNLYLAHELHRSRNPKIKDSPKRADAFKDMAKKCGATVKDVFWTLGEYDVVSIVEAPDDISMTALGLSSGALGNVRTQTLRAFTQADMKTIIGKMVSS